jgi:predicted nucleotidyltransferase
MSFNKLMWYTIVYVLLAGYVSYSSFMLYELRQTNAELIEMNRIQLDLLADIDYDVQPISQFRGLTSNRSFSCEVSDRSAP